MKIKKYLPSIIISAEFETVAVSLLLIKYNLFYLFNFTYIGGRRAAGFALFLKGKSSARRFVQFAVGLYMLIYLGVIRRENMRIE